MQTEMTFEVRILDTGESFPCRAGENILKAMERLGRVGIPVGCRGGGCGVCKVQIRGGRFTTQRMSRAHVSEAEETVGVALACRLSPMSDIDLKIVGRMQKKMACATGASQPVT